MAFMQRIIDSSMKPAVAAPLPRPICTSYHDALFVGYFLLPNKMQTRLCQRLENDLKTQLIQKKSMLDA